MIVSVELQPFSSFNNSPVRTGRLFPSVLRDWTAALLPGLVWTGSSSRYWSGSCLGRFTGTARLCPGKMALEEQCSALPRWRSISLTHVEFPDGTYSQHVPVTSEASISAAAVSLYCSAFVFVFMNGRGSRQCCQIVRFCLNRTQRGNAAWTAKLWDIRACVVYCNATIKASYPVSVFNIDFVIQVELNARVKFF